jgi:hypothetical protein
MSILMNCFRGCVNGDMRPGQVTFRKMGITNECWTGVTSCFLELYLSSCVISVRPKQDIE